MPKAFEINLQSVKGNTSLNDKSNPDSKSAERESVNVNDSNEMQSLQHYQDQIKASRLTENEEIYMKV